MKKIIIIVFVILCVVGGVVGYKVISKDNIEEKNNNTSIDNNSNKVSNEVELAQEIEVTVDEILENATKKISPTGFAGASNNVVVLDEGTLFLYNRSSEELILLATGVADIKLSDDEENVVVVKEDCYEVEEGQEFPNFIIVEE